jgi:hypothetical protein
MENTIELGQLLSRALQEQIEEPGSVSQMEQAIRAQLVEIGRQALSQWLRDVAAEDPARRRRCPHCGEEAQYERQREGQLRTILGVVRFRRAYYRCRSIVCAISSRSGGERRSLSPCRLLAEVLMIVIGVRRS